MGWIMSLASPKSPNVQIAVMTTNATAARTVLPNGRSKSRRVASHAEAVREYHDEVVYR